MRGGAAPPAAAQVAPGCTLSRPGRLSRARQGLAWACTCMYGFPMRTTVEISDAHRAQLLKLAAQRGEKGFSSLVREALDLYMRQQRARREAVTLALDTEGALSDEEADALEDSVRELRRVWR